MMTWMSNETTKDHNKDRNLQNSKSANTIAQHKSSWKSDFIHSAIIYSQNYDNYDECQEDHFLVGIYYSKCSNSMQSLLIVSVKIFSQFCPQVTQIHVHLPLHSLCNATSTILLKHYPRDSNICYSIFL